MLFPFELNTMRGVLCLCNRRRDITLSLSISRLCPESRDCSQKHPIYFSWLHGYRDQTAAVTSRKASIYAGPA
jgi:hypothetical protein